MGVANEARAGRSGRRKLQSALGMLGRDERSAVLTDVLSTRPERFNEVAVAALELDVPDGSCNRHRSEWAELA
jgi:hypothetical protein